VKKYSEVEGQHQLLQKQYTEVSGFVSKKHQDLETDIKQSSNQKEEASLLGDFNLKFWKIHLISQ